MSNYQEGKSSTFTHLGVTYSVDDLIALTRAIAPIDKPVGLFTWIFVYSRPDQARVNAIADRQPIIATLWEGKWVVLDGLHRLKRALDNNQKFIPVRVVTEKEMEKLPVLRHHKPARHIVVKKQSVAKKTTAFKTAAKKLY